MALPIVDHRLLPLGIGTRTHDDIDAALDTQDEIAAATLDPTGWLNAGAVTITYDAANRTITLTGDLRYAWRGDVRELTSPWTSAAHTAGDGEFFLYSTDGTTFAMATSAWPFDAVMVAKITVKAGARTFAINEMHGTWPWISHRTDHFNRGTWLLSGCRDVAGTYTLNTATDAAVTPGFASGVIVDEDSPTTIAAWPEGLYTTMRIAAGGIATFDTTAVRPFRAGASYLYVNNPTTGAETAAQALRYVNVYQILIPVTADTESQKYRMVFLQPQIQYTTVAAAQAEDTRTLSLGDMASASAEYVFLCRLTFDTLASYGNVGKCTLHSIGYIIGSHATQLSVNGVTPTAEQIGYTPSRIGDTSINVHQGLNNSLLATGGVITNYTETVNTSNSGTAITISLANGNIQDITLTGNCTITLPAASATATAWALTLRIIGGAFAYSVTWAAASGDTLSWMTVDNAAPILNVASGKINQVVFSSYRDAKVLGFFSGKEV